MGIRSDPHKDGIKIQLAAPRCSRPPGEGRGPCYPDDGADFCPHPHL